MDFSFSEEQEAVRDLAEQVFGGLVTPERVVAVEATADRFDGELWQQLAASQLLGVAVPEEHGGLGFGILELCLVLRAQGRTVAPVPLLATLAQAALPIAEYGTPAQRERYLPRVADGSCVLTAAYAERGANRVLRSSVRAVADADAWVLDGEKVSVPAVAVAEAVLVPAETDRGLTVFVVPLAAAGLTVERSVATNREVLGTLTFDGVRVPADAVLGGVGGGEEVVRFAVDRAMVGISALVLGCCEEATRSAAAHQNQREQFGRPLATNQGSQLRAADCAIDTDGIALTLWHAAWRLAAGLPARDAVEVAKWWSAEVGQRVVHNTQHLHGGTGADVDFPVHRTFLWVKQLECTFGGGSAHLAALGGSIAAQAKAAVGV
jgi:alkylation response protein AidB-like acyl-CoA dehydrogenase